MVTVPALKVKETSGRTIFLPHYLPVSVFSCQPVQSSEHMAAFGVFGLCQIHAFVDYLRSKLNAQQFEVLFKSVISLVGVVLLSVGAVLMLTGKSVVKLFSFSCPCCETDESADTDQLCIILREDFSMDRAFLLSAGSVLCQEQHPHHCLSL